MKPFLCAVVTFFMTSMVYGKKPEIQHRNCLLFYPTYGERGFPLVPELSDWLRQRGYVGIAYGQGQQAQEGELVLANWGTKEKYGTVRISLHLLQVTKSTEKTQLIEKATVMSHPLCLSWRHALRSAVLRLPQCVISNSASE